MTSIAFANYFEFPVNALYQWHCRPGALERLLPSWLNLQVKPPLKPITEGAKKEIMLHRYGLKFRWVAHHQNFVANQSFQDQQLKGPFKTWVHEHRFFSKSQNSCTLEDSINYKIFGSWVVKKLLKRIFYFRTQRILHDLTWHLRFASHGPKKIAITGASGLIGKNLHAFLLGGGHQVYPLVRRNPKAGSEEIFWNPSTGEVDAKALEGMDAIIHLAGENIAGHCWTVKQKAKIEQSRIKGTENLCLSLSNLQKKPKVFIAASAIGFYGDRGDEPLDERSGAGKGFLAETCQKWEAATLKARNAGIRVVNARLGMVVSAQGGALKKMLPAFKLGMAGRLGAGDQFISWISLDDVLGAFYFLLFNEQITGPVNLVSPNPLTNLEFTKTLGEVLQRPTFLPLPRRLAKLTLGEMAEALLFASTRVIPHVLDLAHFPFFFTTLEEALMFELGLYQLHPIV